jgi:putative endonuclease
VQTASEDPVDGREDAYSGEKAKVSKASKQLGQWGERIAALSLEAKGYEIVARNWRCNRGEIDLVARAGAMWVFVEVKTRRGRVMGPPEQGLTAKKAERLLELGERYLFEHEIDDVTWRVDLIAVELDSRGKLLRCDHIEDAVPGW